MVPHERSQGKSSGYGHKAQLANDIAESTGYPRYWIRQIAKRSNAEDADGIRKGQYTHSHRAQPLLSVEKLAERAETGPRPSWVGMCRWIGSPRHMYRVAGLVG